MAKKKEGIVEEIAEKAEKIVKKAIKKADEVVEEAEEFAEKIEEKIEEAVMGKNKDSKENKKTEKSAKSKLEELKARAKALESQFEESKKVDIKEKVTGAKEEKKDMLVPIEDYLKASIHLGTRVITPHMRPYVYRRRADGLAVFNTDLLDEKIKEGAEYLSKFSPEQFIVVCKREAGWKAVSKFAETIGVKTFTKKYPAGVLTNTNLNIFMERDLVFICDPWLDKNALTDANMVKTPVLSICDTNNYTFGISKIIPGNNKSAKSLGIIFYLLTKLYVENRKMNVKVPSIEEFVDGWDELQPPK